MMIIYAILKMIIMIIWFIDILNIDFIINEIHIAEFLDITFPINTLFWILVWAIIIPIDDYILNNK